MPLLDLPGAIGPSYTGISPAVDGEMAVNLIAETVQANGKVSMYYTKVPGLSSPVAQPGAVAVTVSANGISRGSGILVNTVPVDPVGLASIAVNGTVLASPSFTGGVANGIYINGRRFFIINQGLWELTGSALPFASKNWGVLGTLTGQYMRYSIAVNLRGNQICIASNSATSCFDLTTNTFYPSVTTPEVLLQVDESDGYFIGLAASGNFYISKFQDGTIWGALDFAFEETPDLTMAIKVCNRRLWMFGSNHIELYVDSGNVNFPFTRDQSVYIECGAYRNSLVIADGTIFGIAANARGAVWVFRLDGANTARISTHAIETLWQSYPTVRDCNVRSYQENGHEIIVWNFPTANASWAYDIATNFWAQRGVWNTTTLTWDRDWGETHIYDTSLQLHLVGDYRNSNVYLQGSNYYDFNGTRIRWSRRFPHINSDLSGILYDQLRLIMQTGVTGSLAAATAVTVTLRLSDDGGYKFQTLEFPMSAGASGQYGKKIDWYQLGHARDRVFEIYGDDPIPLALMALKGSVRPCFT